MSTKAARGTKRTCQNPECGARFYDLNRDPITCPICQSLYKLASAPLAAAPVADDKAARRPKKPEASNDDAAGDVPLVEGEEDLADLETDDDDAATTDDEEAFIETEEEEGDVSGLVGSVNEDEEER